MHIYAVKSNYNHIKTLVNNIINLLGFFFASLLGPSYNKGVTMVTYSVVEGTLIVVLGNFDMFGIQVAVTDTDRMELNLKKHGMYIYSLINTIDSLTNRLPFHSGGR